MSDYNHYSFCKPKALMNDIRKFLSAKNSTTYTATDYVAFNMYEMYLHCAYSIISYKNREHGLHYGATLSQHEIDELLRIERHMVEYELGLMDEDA
jgi:hypothetical protein